MALGYSFVRTLVYLALFAARTFLRCGLSGQGEHRRGGAGRRGAVVLERADFAAGAVRAAVLDWHGDGGASDRLRRFGGQRAAGAQTAAVKGVLLRQDARPLYLIKRLVITFYLLTGPDIIQAGIGILYGCGYLPFP